MTPTELHTFVSESEGVPMEDLNPLQYELLQIAEEADGMRTGRDAVETSVPPEVGAVDAEVAKRIELYSQGNDILAQALAAVEKIDTNKRKSEVWAIIASRLAEVGDIAQADAVADRIYIPFNALEKINALSALYVATHDTTYIDRAVYTWEQIKIVNTANNARVTLAQAQAKAGKIELAVDIAEGITAPIDRVHAFAEIYAITQDTAYLDRALAVSETIPNNTMGYQTGKKFIALALVKLGRISDALDIKKQCGAYFDDVYSEIADFYANSGDINQALSACDSIRDLRFRAKALAVVYAASHDPAILAQTYNYVRREWQDVAYEAIAEAQAKCGDVSDALDTAQKIQKLDLQALALSAIAQAIFRRVGALDQSDNRLASAEVTP